MPVELVELQGRLRIVQVPDISLRWTGYWQVLISEEDQAKAAFINPMRPESRMPVIIPG